MPILEKCAAWEVEEELLSWGDEVVRGDKMHEHLHDTKTIPVEYTDV